jgi:hypothetical protein
VAIRSAGVPHEGTRRARVAIRVLVAWCAGCTHSKPNLWIKTCMLIGHQSLMSTRTTRTPRAIFFINSICFCTLRQLLGPVKTKNYIDSLLQKTKSYLPLFLGGKENQTIDFLIN